MLTGVTLTEIYGLPPAPNLFGAGAGPGLLRLPTPVPAPLGLPPGLVLYGFQAEGVRFLLDRPAALLGDEMGLGKSVQAIVAARLLLGRGAVRRALVLCPKSVIFDWWGKFRLWAPELNTLLIYGPRRRRLYDWHAPAHVFIAAYETWREDAEAVSVACDLLILDEIQRLKNPRTRLFQAVRCIEAPVRWGLSGTPLENRLDELVAVLSCLDAGILAGVNPRDPAQVHQAVRPYVLRREKAAALAFLPPKVRREVWLDLHPAQAAAYRRLQEQGLADLGNLQDNPEAVRGLLALLGRLKQVCNCDPDSGASAKLDFLLSELPALCARGEKALIFSQYPERTLRPLLPRLAAFGVELFDGSLSDGRRDFLVRSFQTAAAPRVLAMSLKAGGVGLTLTRANHVYHFDQWWNPAALEQAEDRAHRIGQTRPVYVTTLLTRDTIEARIAQLLEGKRTLFQQVVGALTDACAADVMPAPSDLFDLFQVAPPTHV